MATLDERMREALWALACGETTERALAEEWQLSKLTFHDRKVRALKLLRAELAARGYGDWIINEGAGGGFFRCLRFFCDFFLRCPTKRAFFYIYI